MSLGRSTFTSSARALTFHFACKTFSRREWTSPKNCCAPLAARFGIRYDSFSSTKNLLVQKCLFLLREPTTKTDLIRRSQTVAMRIRAGRSRTKLYSINYFEMKCNEIVEDFFPFSRLWIRKRFCPS